MCQSRVCRVSNSARQQELFIAVPLFPYNFNSLHDHAMMLLVIVVEMVQNATSLRNLKTTKKQQRRMFLDKIVYACT